MAYVLMVEEEDAYVLIKNMWKYDDSDMKKCRNFNGDKFTVEDIEYLIVGERDYLNLDDLRDVPKHLVIRLVKEDKKNMQQMGLEPTQIALHVPETCAYANSATTANIDIIF